MKINRRDFLKRASASIALPYFVSSSALGKNGNTAASDRVVMGFIGTGGQGVSNMKAFLTRSDVQIVAVCDVDSKRRQQAQKIINDKYKNADCADYNDFRDVIARDDIDAVSTALPDHWHAIPAIMAARAGKDIYGEKPLAYNIAEGRAIVEAVNKYGVVWQTGSWQRSVQNFRFACELVRNGRIGKIHIVEVGLPGKHSKMTEYAGHKKDITMEELERICEVPQELDYDFWLGPAPVADYCPGRCHGNYRWISDYSSAQIADWAGHHCDIANWGMDTDNVGPIEVEGVGEYSKAKLWDGIVDYKIRCKYEQGFDMVVASSQGHGIWDGTRWFGDDGWVWVSRYGFKASDESLLRSTIGPNELHLYKSNDHFGNFIDCVKSRAKTITPVEAAHHAIMIGHLGLMSIKVGRKLRWDGENEKVIGDDEANRLLSRPMRGPWHI
jgi:predicted dehydrogenase